MWMVLLILWIKLLLNDTVSVISAPTLFYSKINFPTLKRFLILSILQVLLGIIIAPPAVVHFRSIVTAQIKLCVNVISLALLGVLTQYL